MSNMRDPDLVGSVPESLRQAGRVYAAAVLDLEEATKLLHSGILCDPPLPTERVMLMNEELARDVVRRMHTATVTLANMAKYLMDKAAHQEQVSRGETAATPPVYERQLPDDDTLWYRLAGIAGVVGGSLEAVGGLAAMKTPTIVGQLIGPVLVVHGYDTAKTSMAQAVDGKPHRTATARAVGALTNETVGDAVDLAIGILGPAGVGAAARHTAKTVTNGVELAIQNRTGLGHIQVAVTRGGQRDIYELTQDAGGVNRFRDHAAALRTGEAEAQLRAAARVRLFGQTGERFAVETSEEVAAAARTRAGQLVTELTGTTWGYAGPNCASAANDLLKAANLGTRLVPVDRVPILLYYHTKHPALLLGAGASAANGAGQILLGQTPQTEDQ
jgi:hypothetical protein